MVAVQKSMLASSLVSKNLHFLFEKIFDIIYM